MPWESEHENESKAWRKYQFPPERCSWLGVDQNLKKACIHEIKKQSPIVKRNK